MATTNQPTANTPPGLFDGINKRFQQCIGLAGRLWPVTKMLLTNILTHLRHGDLSILLHPKTARDETFAQWYIKFRAGFANYESTQAVPSLIASARGFVLDLGPGAGVQLPYFDAAACTRVVGVEPNAAFVPTLKQRLSKETPDLEAKYEIALCGVEDTETLAQFGVTEGSLDTVLCTQVLCSVDRPEEAAKRLYEFLKPGGQLLFWEHSQSHSRMTRWAQWLLTPSWRFLIGGCRLNMPIEKIVLQAGNWEIAQLETDSDPITLMPRVWGQLLKPVRLKTVQRLTDLTRIRSH